MMFNLENRDTFIDLLRPGAEWRIEYIFGTSLVVDIRWLFNFLISLSELQANKEKFSDPGLMLVDLRSFRGKMDLFIQSGKIEKISYDILLEEGSQFIRQINVNENQMFHPKVWVVEYRNAEQESMFKTIVSSRNAVFGATLESYILLKGKYDGKNSVQNKQLTSFIEECRNHSISESRTAITEEFLKRLSQTELMETNKFSDEGFYFQGFNNNPPLRNLISKDYDHIAVFSPFLSIPTIDYIRSKCTNFTLVSTDNNLAETLKVDHFKNVKGKTSEYYYVKHFITEDDEDEKNADYSQLSETVPGNFTTFNDNSIFHPGFMHAKMYFLYKKNQPLELILGSANCSEAGLGGTSIEAVVKIYLQFKTIDSIFNSFIFKEGNKDNLYPYIERFENKDDNLCKISDQEKNKREADKVFQNIMNLKWSAAYKNNTINLVTERKIDLDKKINQLKIVNNKLKSDGKKFLFRRESKGFNFSLPISKDAIPGEIFEFSMDYEGLDNSLSCLAIIPINGSPPEWRQKIERQQFDMLKSVSAWYLYIFGLLYKDNPYEKAKTYRYVTSSGKNKRKENIAENQKFSLERLLGIGEITAEIRKEIDDAITVFEEKFHLDNITKEQKELYNEIVAFKDLFKIYSEAMQ